jgi:hypothetical protein
MEPVQIDWASASVSDGELGVALEPAPAAAWRKRFTAVAQRIGRGGEGWGDVAAKKDRLVVADVAEGAEGDLRHFLESVVLEVNGPADDGAPADEDPVDERMTEAFRAFAPADDAA